MIKVDILYWKGVVCNQRAQILKSVEKFLQRFDKRTENIGGVHIMTDYSKEFYGRCIRQEKKTIAEIAEEQGITENTVKVRIRKLYAKKAWAERLITLALENEKYKTVAANKQEEENPILLDTSMLLNYPEALMNKKSKLYIPRFCLHTALKIIEAEKRENPKLAEWHEYMMAKLNLQEVFFQYLPYIEKVTPNPKFHSIMFVRYLLKLRETEPSLNTLTCSREIKEIAALNGIVL